MYFFSKNNTFLQLGLDIVHWKKIMGKHFRNSHFEKNTHFSHFFPMIFPVLISVNRKCALRIFVGKTLQKLTSLILEKKREYQKVFPQNPIYITYIVPEL